MRCSLERQYTHPAHLLTPNQGSMQLLADGRVFVGWGAEPYYSEFQKSGELSLDGQLPTDVASYRAFTYEFHGTPADRPAVAVGANAVGGSSLYVSWNGATEVANWNILAGKHASAMSTIATAQWAGFETAVEVGSTGPYFQAVALDVNVKELGRSAVVKFMSK